MANGFPLLNCRAVITGASSGLGAEFARQLAPQADFLVLVARRAEALEEVKNGLQGQNVRVFTCAADLATPGGLRTLLAFLDAHDLKPNLLINNAGMGDYGSFASSEPEKSRAQIELNVTTLTMLTHAMIPRLIPLAGIVNVSSLASTLPMPEAAVYAASKAYVTRFSEALRIEVRGDGVRVVAVCPGPVRTEFGAVARRGGHGRSERPLYGLLYATPEEVVAETLAGLSAGKACVWPGMGVKVAGRLFRLMPRILLRWLLRRRASRG